MDIRQIRLFCRIVDLRSFSLAADEMHITQPAAREKLLRSTMRQNSLIWRMSISVAYLRVCVSDQRRRAGIAGVAREAPEARPPGAAARQPEEPVDEEGGVARRRPRRDRH